MKPKPAERPASSERIIRDIKHQRLKNRILLEHDFLAGDLEQQIEALVDHDNHQRYHESLDNLTPADVSFGRGESILRNRQRIKRNTLAERRLHYQRHAA